MRPACGVTVCPFTVALTLQTSARGQAALTPTDSAILNSQPLKRLVLAPSLLRRLSLLAAGLDREVVLCLQGTVAGDTALVQELTMPDIVRSSVDVRTPEDLCSLSQPDLRTVVADSIPFAVVSVGRAAQPIVCWWRRVQAVVNRHVKFLPRFPRQWLALPGLPGAVSGP